jgi:hypothetical protein
MPGDPPRRPYRSTGFEEIERRARDVAPQGGEVRDVTQMRAAAIAAFFLGIGLAGEPFGPLHALVAALLLVIFTLLLERNATPLKGFILAFFGVMVTCALQHANVNPLTAPVDYSGQIYYGFYPGSAVVALGLGILVAASFGRRTAPEVISGAGAVVGTALFFLL